MGQISEQVLELSPQYQLCIKNVNDRKDELSINNFSFEREYTRRFKFIMSNSYYLPEQLIKKSLEIIDRNNCINELEKITNCLALAKDIEMGIFEFALNYVNTQLLNYDNVLPIYMDKFYEILDNIDVTNKKINNQTLLPALISGALIGQTIPFLKMYQLHPQRWKYLIDKNNLRDTTLYTVNATDKYKCGRCGLKKHTYYITQTRAADEPATIFYTCINCKKTFTKSV